MDGLQRPYRAEGWVLLFLSALPVAFIYYTWRAKRDFVKKGPSLVAAVNKYVGSVPDFEMLTWPPSRHVVLAYFNEKKVYIGGVVDEFDSKNFFVPGDVRKCSIHWVETIKNGSAKNHNYSVEMHMKDVDRPLITLYCKNKTAAHQLSEAISRTLEA